MNQNLITQPNVPLLDALKKLDKSGTGILLIVDSKDKLLGVITDGDVRRALLKNISLQAPVSEVMNRKFRSWPLEKSRETAILYLKRMELRQLPVVDKNGTLVDIILLDTEEFKNSPNPVVFMAGGMGSRLHPLTQDVPKPMLAVGGKPIVEIMLDRFANQGFDQFFMCTNFKSEYIENHFQSGEKWNVSIKFAREEKRLGTAGALSLLKNDLKMPFVVMNADILSGLDLYKFLEFHQKNPAIASVCVAQYSVEVPYGVVEMKNQRIVNIVEKPTHRFHINSGIYLLDPKVFDFIPFNEFLDMPALLHKLIDAGHTVNSFPLHEYWADIGNVGDYEKANADFGTVF